LDKNPFPAVLRLRGDDTKAGLINLKLTKIMQNVKGSGIFINWRFNSLNRNRNRNRSRSRRKINMFEKYKTLRTLGTLCLVIGCLTAGGNAGADDACYCIAGDVNNPGKLPGGCYAAIMPFSANPSNPEQSSCKAWCPGNAENFTAYCLLGSLNSCWLKNGETLNKKATDYGPCA